MAMSSAEDGGEAKPSVAIKDKVIIHGLSKAAEFNGKEGRILRFEADSGRFIVKLNGGNKTIKVKPGNLESIPSGSGGDASVTNMVNNLDQDQMRKASQALSNATPEQLKRQAESFKNMTSEQMKQLRRHQPQLRGMSDEQIRGMGAQMEAMSRNPDMLKQMSEQMKNMSPEQLKMQQEMMKNMTPDQLKNIEKIQKSMGDTDADQAALSAELMKDMTPEQLSDMMKMQKNMIKKNPELVKKMFKNNPMMANVSPEQLEQQLDMMADMDPKNLERLMRVTQTLQKASAPLVKAYKAVNNATGGRANAILLSLFLMGVYSLVNYLFFGTTTSQRPEEFVGAADPQDEFEDEL